MEESLSLDPEQCRDAEAWLAEAAGRPNYVLAVRRLVDELIKGAVAATIMNRLRIQWASASSAGSWSIAP
jgi:hypothetical protein